MSDHRKNIKKKLGLPEWLANELHLLCPTKESFLLAKYVRDKAIEMGYCDKSTESVEKGFYSDFKFKYKMPPSGNMFTYEDFQKLKEELIEKRDSFKTMSLINK